MLLHYAVVVAVDFVTEKQIANLTFQLTCINCANKHTTSIIKPCVIMCFDVWLYSSLVLSASAGLIVYLLGTDAMRTAHSLEAKGAEHGINARLHAGKTIIFSCVFVIHKPTYYKPYYNGCFDRNEPISYF